MIILEVVHVLCSVASVPLYPCTPSAQSTPWSLLLRGGDGGPGGKISATFTFIWWSKKPKFGHIRHGPLVNTSHSKCSSVTIYIQNLTKLQDLMSHTLSHTFTKVNLTIISLRVLHRYVPSDITYAKHCTWCSKCNLGPQFGPDDLKQLKQTWRVCLTVLFSLVWHWLAFEV